MIREGDPRYDLVQDLIEGDAARQDRAQRLLDLADETADRLTEQLPEELRALGFRFAYDTTPLSVRPEKAQRCPSCEHGQGIHDADGRCWFTVASGLPETNLVCPCKIPIKEEDQ